MTTAAFELGLAVEDDGPVSDGFIHVLADLEEDGVVEMITSRSPPRRC